MEEKKLDQPIRVAVIGGSGYTGAELMRLLLGHPRVEVTLVTGQSKAGMPVSTVLPSLAGVYPGLIESYDADETARRADVAFCALPHGASAGIVSELRDRGLVVLDLSADFRLTDPAVYKEWYGEHLAPARFGTAAYGLVELHRESLRAADLIAVPGCYPTAANLALAPLLKAGLVESGGIIVDAKSGASGAGRSPLPTTHLPEAAEGFRAYKAAAHRHTSEMEQELSKLAGAELKVTFVPHLLPMTRGILATCYALTKGDVTAQACTDAARALYEGSPSVVVRDAGTHPDTLWVRGSNRAHVGYVVDKRAGRVVAMCAIDNLVKGASGQAVQAFNVRFGFDEGEGLRAPAMWP
jgi:N-acetyl-gamma-glutamyl-phosphate reductase